MVAEHHERPFPPCILSPHRIRMQLRWGRLAEQVGVSTMGFLLCRCVSTASALSSLPDPGSDSSEHDYETIDDTIQKTVHKMQAVFPF